MQSNNIEYTHICLIHEKYFDENNIPIFRLDMHDGILNLSEGDIVMYMLYYVHANKLFEQMFNLFTEQYIPVNKYGANYFEGNCINMINNLHYFGIKPLLDRRISELCVTDNMIDKKILLIKKKTQIEQDIKEHPELKYEKILELQNYGYNLIERFVESDEIYKN